MASLIPEVAYEEMLGGVPEVQGEPQRQRRPRLRLWRGIVLLLAGVYFLIPLYAGLRFSFQNDAGQFSLYAVKAIPSQTGFSAAFFLSLRLAAVTTVLTIVLMVPTATYVHLKLPKLRRVLDFVTILPIVIPPIVLILGVLHAAPLWLRSSPLCVPLT
jgi:putative spermidine/putrescine transport system permease protein